MTLEPVSAVETAVYRFPTPYPEADGTIEWDATTAVVVRVRAGDHTGVGYTYSTAAAAGVVADHLADVVCGQDAGDVTACWSAMRRACRNLGTRGLVGQAISAVDVALWDLKSRLLGVPLSVLLGRCRDTVPVYGSGGFTTQDDAQLAAQVAGWTDAGCTAVKIKIGESWGSRVDRDLARVDRLRELVGPGVQIMVDANGGYTVGQARRVGAALDDRGVVWFEEPVSSDDVAGLALLRACLRADVAAGEYAADVVDAARLCPAVDCLQLDATRCGGYTGFLAGAAVAASAELQVSAHCAPSLHAPVAAAVPNLRHVEWFADHARLEPQLFDGTPSVHGGQLSVPGGQPGSGLTLSGRCEPRRRT
ncbi:enolase C-terminal domain-like protein [Nakamurella endophytica]|uniref:Mandelate racemase n=1 Tax=Nakamurella endophytica TaxID=1748367 RepID=A0A917SQN5_9ACTN|nr:enolase C-terminal domain-like protein [Nakamurella endophytica]GGL93067.1 mandelate racemase [Nakamurella endophytica]